MEELINSMKNMFKDMKKEDESDKCFFFSPKYSPVVKFTNQCTHKLANHGNIICKSLYIAPVNVLSKKGGPTMTFPIIPHLKVQGTVPLIFNLTNPEKILKMPNKAYCGDYSNIAVERGFIIIGKLMFLPLEADPKDNNPYDPPGGNYFLSTYHRLGHEPSSSHWETTTQAMLQQIYSREAAVDIRRPLVPPSSGLLLQEQKSISHNRYLYQDEQFLTTYDKDFQKPFPYNVQPTHIEKTTQKTFGLKSHFTSSKICETKFLDDNEVRAAPAIMCGPSV